MHTYCISKRLLAVAELASPCLYDLTYTALHLLRIHNLEYIHMRLIRLHCISSTCLVPIHFRDQFVLPVGTMLLATSFPAT